MDELREQMEDCLSGDLTGLDQYLPIDKISYIVNRLLERPALRAMMEKATGTCEWTPDKYNEGVWWTGCDKLAVYRDGYSTEEDPYCSKCGKKIEVKDGD